MYEIVEVEFQSIHIIMYTKWVITFSDITWYIAVRGNCSCIEIMVATSRVYSIKQRNIITVLTRALSIPGSL